MRIDGIGSDGALPAPWAVKLRQVTKDAISLPYWRPSQANPDLTAIKFLPPMWMETQNNNYSYRKIKVFILHIRFCELRYVTETPGCILCVGTGSSHSK